MIDGAIYQDGKVWVRYYSPVPKYIKIGSKEYVANVNYGVSMLLADEEDVPSLLAQKGGCCGGTRLIFNLPSQEAVNVYLTGDR